MTEQTKLLPCPFCGRDAGHVQGCVFAFNTLYYVRCAACFAITSKFDTESEAVAAWNRRPKPRTNFEAWKEALTLKDLLCLRNGHVGKYWCEILGITENAGRCEGICIEEDNGLRCIEQWANAEVSDA